MINIYGLKNCDSCRKAIKWLKDNNYSYEFFDIKANPIKKSKRILILPSFVHEMHYRLSHFCFNDANDWLFSTLDFFLKHGLQK